MAEKNNNESCSFHQFNFLSSLPLVTLSLSHSLSLSPTHPHYTHSHHKDTHENIYTSKILLSHSPIPFHFSHLSLSLNTNLISISTQTVFSPYFTSNSRTSCRRHQPRPSSCGRISARTPRVTTTSQTATSSSYPQEQEQPTKNMSATFTAMAGSHTQSSWLSRKP